MKYILTIFLVLAIPLVGVADEIERASITYKGTSGYFFSEEIGKRMLGDLKELQINRGREALLGEKIELLYDRIKYKDANIKTTEDIGAKWKEAHDEEYRLRMSERDLHKKELAKKDMWYRSPVFLIMMGLLIGSGLAIGLTFGINEGKS